MTANTIEPADVAEYIGHTRQRITRVSEVLSNLRQGQDEDPNGLIIPLGEQMLASQEAGFTGIARLVRDMSDCLRWTAEVERSLAAGTIDALLDACQCILLHAEAVEAGVYPT